ncbi:ImmA/IrrE family metallo-endopeptidase [Humisphaera borealis]|uniref:ImmA/IrrE family metallo-endopeptidase n=1 Tax=Humisphaera borealis TaxID=2807512 RepID=A0A7M2X4Z5_9BACT|nr:ImmA/IrrE family metallo-endopeptidase [Humisphaera borealis]QOV92121.1 ImmA/IrrE family metallo-endopeptidase [Humisphaera borealis]
MTLDSLDDDQLRQVRDHARKALEKAGAKGCFPTPVDQVIAAAKHLVNAHEEIDEGFLAKARKKVGGALKRALSKVMGVLDVTARTMHLDKLVPIHKLPFLKLHELGHGVLPWQREMFKLTEDCELTIAPEVSELFERESNAFASEVLFQLDSFTDEAASDDVLGLKTPLRLSKRYGASVYSSIRRYVSTNARSCAVIVLEPPVACSGDGFVAKLRRVVVSNQFHFTFGDIRLAEEFTPDDEIGRIVPVGGRRMSRPRPLVLTDRNGSKHECVAEAFAHKYNVFILVCPKATLTKKIVLIAS